MKEIHVCIEFCIEFLSNANTAIKAAVTMALRQ